MRVLVCGGRTYDNREYANKVLDELHAKHPITLVIHGGAKGADLMASLWATRHNIKQRVYYPNWKQHGYAAGPIRNVQMLDRSRPKLVVAFAGGKGTAHMVRYAKLRNVQVIEVTEELV